MIYALDTIWYVFSTAMQTINPTRQLMGYMAAQDWPPKTIAFDSFYLLTLGDTPIGKESWSAQTSFYMMTCQFQWINKGTEASTYNNVLGRNRGDRVRTNYQMRQELLQALYPGFATKEQIAFANGGLTITPLPESIWWTGMPTFVPREDRESGLMFTVATVKIGSMITTSEAA
ncbi:MAG: hypothetical protein KGN01_06185 [Patescibacteria group bacterium]|nr:hypothetical protein [Patescibacteria group bacterium]